LARRLDLVWLQHLLPFDVRACGGNGAQRVECFGALYAVRLGQTLIHLKDLALICSNCHRMIHRTTPWLSIEDLTEIVDAQRKVISGL
jgi:5-methylcytosine-specific restriction protein A